MSVRDRDFDESPLVDHPQTFENAYAAARKGVKEGTYQTVIWDTVTEYGRKVQYLCEDEEKDGRKAWGRLARYVGQAIDRLIKLECHVIVLAHSRLEDGRVELAIPGQSGERIPASFNDVWYLDKRGGNRTFSCKKEGILGSRSLIGVTEVEANVSKLWKKIQDG
jgi:hypothetical protein